MSTTQAEGDVRPLIETHRRKESASVLFTPPVVEKFPDFESRKCLVEALADEINTIPSDIIPYGSLFYHDMIFVYQSRWDEEENMFFIAVDLARSTFVARGLATPSICARRARCARCRGIGVFVCRAG